MLCTLKIISLLLLEEEKDKLQGKIFNKIYRSGYEINKEKIINYYGSYRILSLKIFKYSIKRKEHL